MKRSLFAIVALLVVFSMVLAACGATPEPAPEPTEAPAVEPTKAEEPAVEVPEVDFPVMPGGFLEKAIMGEYSGTTVVVDGPFTDVDEVKFKESMKAFEDATGITVNYIGNKEFEGSISIRVDAGDAPDIADFPQPGLLASFVRQGKIVDPTTYISADWLKTNYNQSWLDMSNIGGQSAGVWHRFNGKSLVWYPKDDFEAAGYTVPTTWDELMALMDQIVSDGDTPWCVGIESGAATGWPATDWMEEFMLRTTSLENYDKWTTGALPFSSPEVKNAAETLGQIWFNDDYVYGGTASIVSTFFGDSPAPMFEDPPKCWMHKQGNFITGFFPEGSEADVDYGFFYLPGIDDAYGKPFLVAGDIMAQFNERPEVNALMEYFTVPQSAAGWIETGGALAAHQTATPDMYGVDLEKGIATLVSEATSFRFDGSDLMPGEVGAGSFWKGMTDWVSGAADLDTVLGEIDASWPEGVSGEVSGPSEMELAGPAGGYLEKAMAGEYAGTTVVVDGPFTDVDEVKFKESMKAFEDATGITVNYIGNKEFEGSISIRVDAGDAPDIADFPQPGLLASFVRQGKIVDPTTFIPMDWLETNYNQSWLDMSNIGGQSAGVWHRFNGKSLVWYPKDDFEAAGYTVPTTWDELIALMDMIVSDGDTPWCVGIESGAATGWPATDWMEEFMLRTTSLENYDKWTTGALPFSSPEVKNAAETLGQIWFNDDYVYGGTASIVSTFFGDSPAPMFEDPPKCWMHKQGNFITGFFPEGSEADVDYGFFYLPGIDDAYGKPFLVAGDIMAMFNDRPEVRALMEYFTTPLSAKGWLETGGALAAHQTATPDMYGVDLEKGIAVLVNDATSFRFDGSDLMPGEVGAGSFWKGMTDWVSGAADLDTVLGEIDASWPEGVSGEVSGPAEEGVAAPPGGSLEKALAGEYTGTEVSVMGVMVEEDGLKFEQSFAPFEEATGIDVVYEGTKEFEATIGIRVDADDPPDVADFPQPGLLASFARQGKVIDVSQYIDMDHLQGNYSQGWLDMATMAGPDGDIMSGVWHRTAGKSFIWYPKKAFDAAGYEIPTTWDELLALTQQIADDGDTAWCIGIESGVATGWVATDWMENIMLRTTTPENYDKWVSHELSFTSPEVKNAAETMAEIWLNEDYVYGGTAGIVSIFIGDSPVPMFEDPPGCWLHAQAPWITGFFGEGLESGVDYDFFTMPPIDATYGTPVLVAGDLMAAFDDRPEVLALMEWFSIGAGVEQWVKAGGAISMHNDSSLDWYTNDIDRAVAKAILEAETVRFDASDLMPGEVGAGSFWKGMTDWVSGSTDLDTALQEIDDSWPE